MCKFFPLVKINFVMSKESINWLVLQNQPPNLGSFLVCYSCITDQQQLTAQNRDLGTQINKIANLVNFMLL